MALFTKEKIKEVLPGVCFSGLKTAIVAIVGWLGVHGHTLHFTDSFGTNLVLTLVASVLASIIFSFGERLYRENKKFHWAFDYIFTAIQESNVSVEDVVKIVDDRKASLSIAGQVMKN